MSKTDYGSGISRSKIEDKDSFDLKGQFLKELRDNTFSGSDHEDANEHIKKVLEIERGFGILPGYTKANPRDHVKSISTTVEADTNLIRHMGSPQYAVSTPQNRRLMFESRQSTIPFPSRLNDYYFDEKKGSYGPYFLEAYSYGASHIDNSIPRKEKDPGIVENMDGYRDQDMGDIILGEPFYKASCVEARRFDGLITIQNGNDNVTYQIARSHPRFKHLSNSQCNKIKQLLKIASLVGPAGDPWDQRVHSQLIGKDLVSGLLVYELPLSITMTKVIKVEFEKLESIKVCDVSLTCNISLGIFRLTECKALASNLRRIQVKDIVKKVEDHLKTYSSAGMDISRYVEGIRCGSKESQR
ncbi:hypothetical protein Tco_0078192 [Tanacetum coccineum]